MKPHRALLVGILGLFACRESSAPRPVDPRESRPVSGSLPADHPPLGGAAGAQALPDGMAGMATGHSGELTFSAQPGWVQEPPSNAMRVAQFRLPAAEGDSKDGELVVFSFPGGGGVEDNLARWCGMFEMPDGGDPRAAASRTELKHDTLAIHRLELAGTYRTSNMAQPGQEINEPNWRLLGAVVEGTTQPYFIKCVGPDKTLLHWRDSFAAFLGQLERQPGH